MRVGDSREIASRAYQALDSSRVAAWAIASMLAMQFALLSYSAWVHSPTLNEPAHLAAGLSHWKFGNFDLYCVNPPLVRTIAAIPLLVCDVRQDWKHFGSDPANRPEFLIGCDFIRANREHAYFLTTISRIACVPIILLGGLACYWWSRDLFGRPAGIASCALWVFSPTILGHGALLAPDAHAAALSILASYTFWRWLKSRRAIDALIASVCLGIALLAKSTLLALVPCSLVAWLIFVGSRWRHTGWKQVCAEAGTFSMILMGSIYVVNLGYGFEGTFDVLQNYPLRSQFARSLASMVRTPQPPALEADTDGQLCPFAGGWAGGVPIPVPRNYLVGIDIQQCDFEDFGQPSYLRGVFQHHGWWYFYLYALAIKVPLGTWLLALVAIVGMICRPGLRAHFADECALILPPLIILTTVSAETGFSLHMRYVLPCLPYAFVFVSRSVACFRPVCGESVPHFTRIGTWRGWPKCAVVGLVWSIASALWIYPHNLSYFNELVGGPRGGSWHLLQSNVDWGQDLRYLPDNLGQKDCLQPVYLAYFGAIDPADQGLSSTLPWTSSIRNDLTAAEEQSANSKYRPGTYAISVNLLYGYPDAPRDGSVGGDVIPNAVLQHFRERTPVAYAGYSIVLYNVER